MTSFSGDSVLAQIQFKLAIRAALPPLTGICYPLVNTATIGQTVSWVASPDNGSPPYTYSWSGSEGMSGNTSLVQKIYTSAGTKTATVIITSEGRSSLPIACASSVIITSPSSSGGGGGSSGGGGGGSIINTPTSPKQDTVPELDSAPSEDTTKTDGITQEINDKHPECPWPNNPTFRDAKDYLVCDNLITKRGAEAEYEYERSTYRKELLGIATKIHLKHPDSQEKIKLSKLSASHGITLETSSNYSYHFLDVGLPGEPEWVSQTVELGVVFGLITNKNAYFRPDYHASRAESFAMLMKSVCMDPDQSIQKNWQQRVYEVALRNGITSRSWRDFRPNDPILRQELFLITARLDRWKDMTGGCDRYGHIENTSPKTQKETVTEENSRPSCALPDNPSPQEAQKYLICDNLLTANETKEDYNAGTQRITMLGLGLEMLVKHRVVIPNTYVPVLRFLDIGTPGQEPWIGETVIRGVQYGLVSNQETNFRPHDYATWGETLPLLFSSVCMDPNDSIQSTLEERIYEIALLNDLTQKPWENFDFDDTIKRGELFILVAKLNQWKDITGGCDTFPRITPQSSVSLVLESAPIQTNPPTQETVSNAQKPGTFAILYENETEKVYTYIIKSGGIPDGVRAQYLRVFSRSKAKAPRLTIHDIAGNEYPEDRWLLGGELVYVTFKK